jgi:hypothetical protein
MTTIKQLMARRKAYSTTTVASIYRAIIILSMSCIPSVINTTPAALVCGLRILS